VDSVDERKKVPISDNLRGKDIHIIHKKYPQSLTVLEPQKNVDIVDN